MGKILTSLHSIVLSSYSSQDVTLATLFETVLSHQAPEDIAEDQGPVPDQGRGLRGLAQGLSLDQQR